MNYARELAQIALDIGAIKLNPENPFTWASGYRMPVYNDNRLLLGDARHRELIAQGMRHLIEEGNDQVDVVAGTATAGIPHATSLANLLKTPLIYVRPAPKDHGLQNQIEGRLLPSQTAVVVEDLISTGGSALKAVEAIRKAGAKVDLCISIFNYGFPVAREQFEHIDCRLKSLLDFPYLIEYSKEKNQLNASQKTLLEDWYRDPFEWAARHDIS